MGFDRMAVAKQLQQMRRNAGFKSARAFANHIGMNVSTYTDFEQGNRPLSYERAWQFADALNCTMDELGGRQFPKSKDADTESVANRYSALPMKYREPVKDMLELQETKSRVRVSGNQGVSGIA